MENKNLVLSLTEGTPCVCVYFFGSETPGYLDYGHKGITSIVPAWQTKYGAYIGVKDGKAIKSGSNMIVWSLLSGAAFSFEAPEGQEPTKIFLTRNLFGKKEYFWLTGSEATRFEFGNKAAKGSVVEFKLLREPKKKVKNIFGLTA